MTEGSWNHKALEKNNIYKIIQHEDQSPKTLIRNFCAALDAGRGDVGDWAGETVDRVYNRGKVLLPLYLKRFSKYYQPDQAERKFEFNIGDVRWVCYMDSSGVLRLPRMMGRNNVVVDYKVKGKTQTQAEIESSPQLTSYGWASKSILGMKDPVVGFCNLKKTVVPSIEWKPAKITIERLRWFKKLVLNVANNISKGCFPLAQPDSWLCSERWCGYYEGCRGKCNRKRRTKVWSANKGSK